MIRQGKAKQGKADIQQINYGKSRRLTSNLCSIDIGTDIKWKVNFLFWTCDKQMTSQAAHKTKRIKKKIAGGIETEEGKKLHIPGKEAGR